MELGGLEEIDERHFRPLASSTAARQERNPQTQPQSFVGGSFIDIDSSGGAFPENPDLPPPQHQLHLSFSAFDQSHSSSSKAVPREVTGSKSETLAKNDYFETHTWGGGEIIPRVKLDDVTSRNSSLGLIELDAMTDLSASVFSLNTSPREPVGDAKPSVSGGNQPSSVTHQDSTQPSLSGSSQASSMRSRDSVGSDSRNNWVQSNVETIKKRPSMVQPPPVQGVRQSLAFGAADILSGENEADVTIPEIQLLEDELNQLDADFSYFDDLDGCNSDEDFPEGKKTDVNVGVGKLDSRYFRSKSPSSSEAAEEKMDAFPSLSKVTLFEDGGSQEDLVNVSKQNRQRAPPIRHRTEISDVHSGSEIDTEDELEMARKTIGQEEQERSRTMGQSMASMSGNLRPGLEGVNTRESGNGHNVSSMMRQSAEGDVVTSPVPGDGGGGGDGSSDSDSEDRTQSQLARIREVFERLKLQNVPSRDPNLHNPEEQRVRPMGDDLLTEKGINRYSDYQGSRSCPEEHLLHPRFLTAQLTTDMTTAPSWSGLDDSTFVLDDLLDSQPITSASRPHVTAPEQSPGDRLEASGFNADDANGHQPDFLAKEEENPFGGLESSFGSFGASPPAEISMDHRTSDGSRSQNSSVDRISGTSGTAQSFTGSFDPLDPSSFETCSSSDKKTVYRDEDGDYVTDLAFRTSFLVEVGQQQDAQKDDKVNFTDKDFFGSGEAVDMLDNDEVEFKQENIFRQDEVFVPTTGVPLEESWAMLSRMSVSCPLSLQGSDDDYTRISIGAFMKSRSGALGSIDGGHNERPEFGMACKTPPENKKPVALLDDTAMNRTAGVGNEEGDATLVDEAEMTVADLVATLPTNQGMTIIDDEQNATASQSTELSASDLTNTLSISDISRVISTMSQSATPEELALLIMSLSGSKKPRPKKGQSKVSDIMEDPVKNSTNREETEGRSLSKTENKICVVRRETEGDVLSRELTSKSRTSKLPVKRGSNLDTRRRSSTTSDSEEKSQQSGSKDHTALSQEDMMKSKPDGEESEDEAVVPWRQDSGLGSVRDGGPEQGERDKWRSPRLSMAPSVRRLDTQNTSSPIRSTEDLFGLISQAGEGQAVNNGLAAVSRNLQSREQQPADGQASQMDLFVQTSHVGSPINSHLSPSPNGQFSRANVTHLATTASRDATHEGLLLEKSPRSSSTSLGLTGHHIPDGTEYSFQADVGHASNMGSREDLVGTADIQLADSRGFNLINSREPSHVVRKSANVEPGHTTLRTQSTDERGLILMDVHGSNGSLHDLDLGQLKNLTNRDERGDSVKIAADSFARPGVRGHGVPCRSSHSPGFGQSYDEADKADAISNRHYSDPTGLESLMKMPRCESLRDRPSYPSEVPGSSASSSLVPRPTSSNTRDYLASLAMPPPPVPSFRHKLLPKKHDRPESEKPLLLTSQSMGTTSFAEDFLRRDMPHPYLPDDTVNHNHHHLSQTIHSLSTLAPTYQSTPFSKGDNSTQFLSMDNLIMTQSSMHTMMSTGPLDDLTPIHTATQNFTKSCVDDLSTKSMSTSSKKFAPVDAPSVLEFPNVCCVGISSKALLPLTNPTLRWLECNLEVHQLTLDGQSVTCDSIFPFEMKSNVIIEPQNTEDISVIFIPKVSGTYVAQLHIFSHLFLRDKEAEVAKVATTITITAIAEKPQIQVVTDGHRHLDFGHVAWGSSRDMALSIVNEGLAMIPLRLVIFSTKKPWHCFAFDQRNCAADMSVISRSSRPQIQALGKTVVTMCLPGRRNGQPNDPREIIVYCRPPEKRSDRAMSLHPPDEMTARVEVEVDTPSSHLPPLITIGLSALVGVAKLHIARNLESITLMAPEGQNFKECVTFKNAGNINMELRLSTAEYEDAFIVTPKRIVLVPGENAEASIKFLPVDRRILEFQTVMLMHIMPDGPTYELPVLGKVVKKSVYSSRNCPLMSDRHFLCYGSVAVGKTAQKKLTLLSKSEDICKVRIEIRSHDNGDFQLQGTFNNQPQELPTRSKDVVLKPLEKYPIYVLFAPSSVGESGGKLILKPSMSTFKYSIPLSGSGGSSNIIIEGAQVSEKDHYWLDMGEISVGRRSAKRVTLRNIGLRAAYIRAACCTDLRCKQALTPGRVLVEPNEFVLGPEATRTVVLVLNPTHRESALCVDHKDMVGVVCFLYGTELSRQRMRWAIDQGRQSKPLRTTQDELVKTIRFCNHFLDEESVMDVHTGHNIGTPQTDVDLFYSSMSRVKVLLVGEPQKSTSSTVTPQLHQRLSHLSDAPEPLSNSNQDLGTMGSTLPATVYNNSQTEQDNWIVKPDQMILNVPRKRGDQLQVQKFVIINYSKNRSMTFELCWPGHWIKLTPERGTVEPQSSTSVCLSPSATACQRLDQLPWSGSIHISCDNQYMVLRVQIRHEKGPDEMTSVNTNTLVPLSAASVVPSFSLSGSHDVLPRGLHVSTTTVTFPPTKVGEKSASSIDVVNCSKETMQWILTSFAPPYVKGADSSKDVFRATYKVFEFAEKYGQLIAMRDAQLRVNFMPRSKGMFTQHWDIQSKSPLESSNTSTTTRVQLCGEGLEETRSALVTINKDDVARTLKEETTRSLSATGSFGTTGSLPGTESMSATRSLGTTGSFRSTGSLGAATYKGRKSQGSKEKGDSRKTDHEKTPVVLKDGSSTSVVEFSRCRPQTTVTCKIGLKNESKALHVVEVERPSPPFSIRHTKINVHQRSFLRFPVDFSPQSAGHYMGQLVLKVDTGYNLSVKLEGHCS